jgi:hypothetical protein
LSQPRAEQIERDTRDVLADILTVLGADTAAHGQTRRADPT